MGNAAFNQKETTLIRVNARLTSFFGLGGALWSYMAVSVINVLNVNEWNATPPGLKGTLSPISRYLWKAKGHILISGNPKILVEFRLKLLYQFSEIIIECVLLRIVRMDMVATWKHQADVFKFFLCFVEKSPVTDYGLFFLWDNHLISFSWRSRSILCTWKKHLI